MYGNQNCRFLLIAAQAGIWFAWAQAQEWIRAGLSQSVDLKRAPVFSITVLQMAIDRFLLHLSAHHLAVDGHIDTHEIACRRNAMTQPALLAHVGRVLATRFDVMNNQLRGLGEQSR